MVVNIFTHVQSNWIYFYDTKKNPFHNKVHFEQRKLLHIHTHTTYSSYITQYVLCNTHCTSISEIEYDALLTKNWWEMLETRAELPLDRVLHTKKFQLHRECIRFITIQISKWLKEIYCRSEMKNAKKIEIIQDRPQTMTFHLGKTKPLIIIVIEWCASRIGIIK